MANLKPNKQVLDEGMARMRKMADDAIIQSLSELAEASIKHVLTITRGYTHQTFNLRDSYGYAIFHNSKEVKKWMNNPSAKEPDSRGESGAMQGSDFLYQFSSTKPWQLVVVAGEFYAADVQITAELDVLTGAYQYTQENFLNDFKRI